MNQEGDASGLNRVNTGIQNRFRGQRGEGGRRGSRKSLSGEAKGCRRTLKGRKGEKKGRQGGKKPDGN